MHNSIKYILPTIKTNVDKFMKSVWLFPALLTILLVLLTSLQINGSSIGTYHDFFYGNQTDKDLVANKPRPIRSDEWMVNTQKAIGQKNNNLESINHNVGNGEDARLLADEPYLDWSIIFKPHNLGYLLLPLNNAFALHWWMPSYLLVLSVYFFILKFLPRRRMIASLLSLSFLFSPFFQWWYSNGTIGSVYWPLFGIVAFVSLLKSKKWTIRTLWSLLLSYIAVAFMLILYPPFQIPTAIVSIFFLVGYLLKQSQNQGLDKKVVMTTMMYAASSLLLSASVVGLFIYQSKNVIETLQNTAYPGKRIVESGNYNKTHFFTSNLAPLFQNDLRADAYRRPSIGATNQSESSNFIVLFPFLILPLSYLCYRTYKRKKEVDYIVLSLFATAGIFFAWLFIPELSILGQVSLLNKVPLPRLLIGIGLMNVIFTCIFIKLYSDTKIRLNLPLSVIYGLLSFIFYLVLNFRTALEFPNFIGLELAILLAIPIPLVIFLLLRKHYLFALSVYLIFSLFSVYQINPLYKGTDVLTQTPISLAIRQTSPDSNKKWVSEDKYLENFAAMNGRPSLTGTYLYPQLEIWKGLSQKDRESSYNRYAHVNFTFDRNAEKNIKPIPSSPIADQFNLTIEPCDRFLKYNNVGFLITSAEFEEGAANCASLLRTVNYPQMDYFIYKLNF